MKRGKMIMEITKDNIMKMLDALQAGMDEARKGKNLSAKRAGYILGYEAALKNIRFIVSVNMK